MKRGHIAKRTLRSQDARVAGFAGTPVCDFARFAIRRKIAEVRTVILGWQNQP